MKHIFFILLSISICLIFLISCGEDKDTKIKELQHQVQIEKQLKEIERQAKDTAQRDADKWQDMFNLLIGLGIAIVIISLLTGVAMGSKARKDAKNQCNIKKGEIYEPK